MGATHDAEPARRPTPLRAQPQGDHHRRGPDPLHVKGQRIGDLHGDVVVGRLTPGGAQPGVEQTGRRPLGRPGRLPQQVGGHHQPYGGCARGQTSAQQSVIAPDVVGGPHEHGVGPPHHLVQGPHRFNPGALDRGANLVAVPDAPSRVTFDTSSSS